MLLGDAQLDRVVQGWRDYAIQNPRRIRPRELLKQRGVYMYRGLGVTTAEGLARRMVDDRSAASLEMTMGSLYERVLQALGPERVTREQRRNRGYHGLDFIRRTAEQIEIINLKAGLSTTNDDVSQNLRRNLLDARDYWQENQGEDDNPLPQEPREVVMVKAMARGQGRRDYTTDGILYLVGNQMWRHFGGGNNFLARLGDALGRNPLDLERYEVEKGRATERVRQYLTDGRFADGKSHLDWRRLTDMFP